MAAVIEEPRGGNAPLVYNVAVVGPGDDATSLDVSDATKVGLLLGATRRIHVVTGGLGGVMAAASAGAARAGGSSVALLPDRDITESGAPAAPRHCVLPTGLGELRNGLLVRVAHAVVSVGCSWGTLSEMAIAVRTGTPIFSIRPWRVMSHEGEQAAGISELPDPFSVYEEVCAVLGIAPEKAS